MAIVLLDTLRSQYDDLVLSSFTYRNENPLTVGPGKGFVMAMLVHANGKSAKLALRDLEPEGVVGMNGEAKIISAKKPSNDDSYEDRKDPKIKKIIQ